jgi:hypothetical protein
MKSLFWIPVLAAGLFVGGLGAGCSHPPKAVSLGSAGAFAQWRGESGTWREVGGVTLDSANPKAFLATPGQGVMLNSAAGHTVDLLTVAEFGDCELHVEFSVPKDSNSGVYLLGRYEVQVFDSWGKRELASSDCGGLYASCSGRPECYAGQKPPFNASKAPGEWQSFDVVFRAPRFDAAGRKTESARFVKVSHNGRVLHENVEVTCPTCAAAFSDEKPTGPLKIQGDHGPVAYRNLRLKPVTLP